MTQTIDEMIANVMPMAPVNPGAFSGMQAQRPMPQAEQMMQNMPVANLDPTSQESMMNYLMEKVEQIRQRTGAQGQEGMGALDALMKSMPRGRIDGMMPQGSMRDGQRTYFENQRFDNIDPRMVRNVRPGMDKSMVRIPPMGMR
tara:strand:+ start:51 stop:482 length:432 start_codon:yes stop_codon:yes gene_type:complete